MSICIAFTLYRHFADITDEAKAKCSMQHLALSKGLKLAFKDGKYALHVLV